MADHAVLDSLAYGTILESAYNLGGTAFAYYGQRASVRRWMRLMECAGLPLNPVVAGVSEVATSKIVCASPYGSIAQSCIRGDVGKPCRSCWKCFRKMLMEAALQDQTLDETTLQRFFSNLEPQRFLKQDPIKHQVVLAYATEKYAGTYKPMTLLHRKIAIGLSNHQILEKWYSPSEAEIVPKYRETVKARIATYLAEMSSDEQAEIERWDIREALESEAHRSAQNAFVASLRTHQRARASLAGSYVRLVAALGHWVPPVIKNNRFVYKAHTLLRR
jgi:hypothetical protein